MTSTWRVVKKVSKRLHGQVWQVSRDAPNGMELGYFKFATTDQRPHAGPMVANELIAAELGRVLGLPVARVEVATINGHTGIVSIARPADVMRTWRDLPPRIRQNFRKHLKNPNGIYGMVVFDVWTTNFDRTESNIILYRRRRRKRYGWYLIDHGQSLFGSYRKWQKRGRWDQPIWTKVWRTYKLPKSLAKQMTSFKRMRPWIKRVQAIPDRNLAAMVADVPREFLSPYEADCILAILRRRRPRLAGMLRSWVERAKQQN